MLGNTGTGKSTSIGRVDELGIKGVNPDESVLIKVLNKHLPFPGGSNMFQGQYGKGGNLLCTDNAATICGALQAMAKDPKVKVVILDDAQYIMSNEFIRSIKEAGFDKFNRIGANMCNVLLQFNAMRNDQFFFVLSHCEVGPDNQYKMMTIGKLADDKGKIDGYTEITLYSRVIEDPKTGELKMVFCTRADMSPNGVLIPARISIGMFEEKYIPNDLGYVIDRITAFDAKRLNGNN